MRSRQVQGNFPENVPGDVKDWEDLVSGVVTGRFPRRRGGRAHVRKRRSVTRLTCWFEAISWVEGDDVGEMLEREEASVKDTGHEPTE